MITFKGIKDEDLGVVFDSFPVIKEGERKASEVVVAGKDEPLTIDDGSYNNAIATFTGHVIDSDWSEFLKWMDGSGKLAFDLSPKYYRNARVIDITKNQIADDIIYFSVTMSLSAYSYLYEGDKIKKGEEKITFNNPTEYDAFPFIKINANDELSAKEFQVLINETKILTIPFVNRYIYIDSELDFVYYSSEELKTNRDYVNADIFPLDEKTVGETPILRPGLNTLQIKSTSPTDVLTFEITPRWRDRV